MRKKLMAALVGTALVAGLSAQSTGDSRFSDSLERAFVPNGRVKMDLSAGSYRITGTNDKRIRVRWTVDDAGALSDVRARADVRGSNATITLDGPTALRGKDFTVNIQLPSHADLYVRLTAGELTIEDVEGNKDVGLHAGEIHIDVGRAEDYGFVDSSVWAGEIHATPYNLAKEVLFRSLEWKGKGKYKLHTSLKAGEIHLYSKSAQVQE
jgi:hypothetical protein